MNMRTMPQLSTIPGQNALISGVHFRAIPQALARFHVLMGHALQKNA